MTHRRFTIPILVAAFWFAACGQDPPPPPEPTGDETPAAVDPGPTGPDPDSAAEAARLAAEREARIRAARATLEEIVHFDYDRSDIRPDAEQVLRQKVEILRASPGVQLRIEGHADERGSTEYNFALGNRRAETVRQYFADFGLSSDRFTITSYGEDRPLVSQSSESAWAQNRRAEFVITAGADQIDPGGNQPDR